MASKRTGVLQARFPLRGFVAVVWVRGGTERKVIYPLPSLYVKEDELTRDLDYLRRELARGDTEVVDRVIILPVKLREMCDMPIGKTRRGAVNFGVWDRLCEFLKLLEIPEFYDLLVTARKPQHADEEFLVSLPFLHSSQKSLAEKFVSLSDFPVDFKYHSYAIYQPGEMFVYDYKSREIYRDTSRVQGR